MSLRRRPFHFAETDELFCFVLVGWLRTCEEEARVRVQFGSKGDGDCNGEKLERRNGLMARRGEPEAFKFAV